MTFKQNIKLRKDPKCLCPVCEVHFGGLGFIKKTIESTLIIYYCYYYYYFEFSVAIFQSLIILALQTLNKVNITWEMNEKLPSYFYTPLIHHKITSMASWQRFMQLQPEIFTISQNFVARASVSNLLLINHDTTLQMV